MTNDDRKKDSVEVAMIDSVSKAEFVGIGSDLAEVAFDAVMNDGLLKDIPVFGTVAGVVRSGVALRDRIFLKKVHSFLFEVNKASKKDRDEFVKNLSEKKGRKEKAGAALMLLLDKLDDIDKPEIVGRIYIAKIEGRISEAELRRFCMIIERAFIPDLLELAELKDGEKVDDDAAPLLAALGVVTLSGENYGTLDGIGAETWYEINETGKKFVSVALT